MIHSAYKVIGILLIGLLSIGLQNIVFAQSKPITLSGRIKSAQTKEPIGFVSVALKRADSTHAFVIGTITNEDGFFSLPGLKSGDFVLETSFVGFQTKQQVVAIGKLSDFLDLGVLFLLEDEQVLREVVVADKSATVSAQMDKKTFSVADQITQSGGSALQVLGNLPGVVVTQEGKVQLRGSDRVVVLIDGKQTALTGFDNQKGLENLPASAIERIEIINNPSAKYDANGNAGIVNIIFKKNDQQGWNGKIGFAAGLGALWQKRENLPTIRPQFQRTPKINPSASVNFRNKKVNFFGQADWLYTQTLNKNEFATRTYDDGTTIIQQVKRNRTTDYTTLKTGIDFYLDPSNTLTVSGLFNREKIDDRGDNPYFLNGLSERYRLWQFIEDEVKYTASGTATFVHKFQQAGRILQANSSYYFHREDEKYFFTNTLPAFTGMDAFALISDEHVFDASVDYQNPLRHGRFEVGAKFRRRVIPVNMQFFAGQNSPIDTAAGGWANYYESIPALYGNYVFESKKWEFEGGLRAEYVGVDYQVNPNHNTYKSDGYTYAQPFPNVRVARKIGEQHRISLFFNRRVDRPGEVDIRIFPKYDEPELIKVGNPALRPQFTTSLELGYKNILPQGSFYAALYRRQTEGTIVRIAAQSPTSVLLYHVFQNAGRSNNTGLEVIFQQKPSKKINFTLSANVFENEIAAFSVVNLYPERSPFSAPKQRILTGNAKLNLSWLLPKGIESQWTATFLAPELVPQGKIGSRFWVDGGLKKSVRRGEWFFNATDILNTFRLKKTITGAGFVLQSTDYYETQVFRGGYSWKF
jgi:outer membrane receptor protein involved in Fe transport